MKLLIDRGVDPSIRAVKRDLTALEFAREKLAEQQKAGIEAGHSAWKNFKGVIALLD